MNFYKLKIEYRGTNYHGFQIQNNERTIQGELNRALKQVARADEIKSIGSGRTDAGVHALAQIVRVEIPLAMPGDKLKYALNSMLPNDIRILDSEVCTADFHPIFSAQSKEYRYYFAQSEFSSAHLDGLVTHYDFELDLEIMKRGCALLIGKHDFINYQCTGTDVETTIREIYQAELLAVKDVAGLPFRLDSLYCFRVVGDGFLKQMVRLLMGALWSLGRHKITLHDFEESLKLARKDRYGVVAPPDGLYLYRVDY
ncbi:MAG: tRNA pseudouridine(38-40) synthase TruA [Bacteriovoracaceae bacterium]|nr:tRNA pseudouridine(38-40) synthase TruA [Bacteriovoracaceae bacterium]